MALTGSKIDWPAVTLTRHGDQPAVTFRSLGRGDFIELQVGDIKRLVSARELRAAADVVAPGSDRLSRLTAAIEKIAKPVEWHGGPG